MSETTASADRRTWLTVIRIAAASRDFWIAGLIDLAILIPLILFPPCSYQHTVPMAGGTHTSPQSGLLPLWTALRAQSIQRENFERTKDHRFNYIDGGEFYYVTIHWPRVLIFAALVIWISLAIIVLKRASWQISASNPFWYALRRMAVMTSVLCGLTALFLPTADSLSRAVTGHSPWGSGSVNGLTVVIGYVCLVGFGVLAGAVAGVILGAGLGSIAVRISRRKRPLSNGNGVWIA